MDKKTSEQVEITLFDGDAKLAFPVYNDVTIVFGAKGTGKTALLKKIESHFRAKGWTDVSSYYASENNDKYKQMVTVNPREEDFVKLGVDDASDKFAGIRAWNEPAVTPFSDYISWEEYSVEKKDTARFGFALASAPVDPDLDAMRGLIADYKTLISSANNILNNKIVEACLSSNEFSELRSAVLRACMNAQSYVRSGFVDAYALHLECFTVKKMKSYITA